MLHTYVIHHRLNEREKMLQLGEGSCFPGLLVGVNVGLAFVDGIIASLAFAQVCFLFIIIINFYLTFFLVHTYSPILIKKMRILVPVMFLMLEFLKYFFFLGTWDMNVFVFCCLLVIDCLRNLFSWYSSWTGFVLV